MIRVAGAGVEGARAAFTGWEVLERCEGTDGARFARVRLTPVTGRALPLLTPVQFLSSTHAIIVYL